MKIQFTQALSLALWWLLPIGAQAQIAVGTQSQPVNGDFETRINTPQGINNIYSYQGSYQYDDLPSWEGVIPPPRNAGAYPGYSVGGDYLSTIAGTAPRVNPLAKPDGGAFQPHGGNSCIALRRFPSTGNLADQGVWSPATPIIPGHVYQLDYYVLRRPTSQYAEKIKVIVSRAGASWDNYTPSFTSKDIRAQNMPYASITSPAITDYQNWTHVTGTFTAETYNTTGPTANSSYFIITYDRQPGTYDPSLYVAPGNYNFSYYAIDDISITDLSASCSTAPGPISGYYSPSVGTLDVSIAPVPGATSYNWYKDGQMSFGHGNNNTWRGPRNECGSPTVEVEAVFACGTSPRTSRTFQGPTTDCDGPILERTTNTVAYPNPAAESITIPVGVKGASLVNDKGRTLRKADASGKLDVQTLPDGLYNLQMMRNGKLINQRIQVKH